MFLLLPNLWPFPDVGCALRTNPRVPWASRKVEPVDLRTQNSRYNHSMEYIQITEDTELPDISGFAPFKAVIAIQDPVSEDKQAQISTWLVEMGGLYVMICGENSTSWEGTIRQANLEQTDIETMTPDQFVMITDHEDERLRTVFWHAKKHAKHTHAKLEQVVVLHISNENRAVDYLSIFNKA